jgi:hypothetical protein
MNPNTKLKISSSSKSAINDTYVFSEITDCFINPETFWSVDAKNITYIGESDPNKYITFLIENKTPDIISLISVSRINPETNPITYGYEWAWYLGSNLNPIKDKGKNGYSTADHSPSNYGFAIPIPIANFYETSYTIPLYYYTNSYNTPEAMDFGLVNPTRYYNFTATIQHIT